MSGPRNVSWRTVGVIGVCGLGLLAGTALLTASESTNPSSRPRRPLGIRNDVLNVEQTIHDMETGDAANPRRPLMVLLACDERRLDHVARIIQAWGGTIVYTDRPTGYLRVSIPAVRWADITALDDVIAADLDGPSLQRLAFEAPEHARPRVDQEKPAPARAQTWEEDDHPRHSITQSALGLDRLWSTHPTFDGRGVGIAILEPEAGSVAIEHPAFASARDLNGQPRPKIGDVIVVNPLWRTVHSQGREGSLQHGRLETPTAAAAVVWDSTARIAWVDTNGDGDFQKETPLHDMRDDGGASAVFIDGESFRVTFEGDSVCRPDCALTFHRRNGSHVTMDASVAAGSRGTAAVGTAPSAQLALVDPHDPTRTGRASTILESILAVAQRPDVDVISMSMVAPRALPAAGTDVLTIVIDRVTRAYNKVLIRAAGNEMGYERTGDFGSSTLDVGAYLPAAAGAHYFGLTGIRADLALPYSSRGPRADGAGEPDVISPAVQVVAAPCPTEPRRVETTIITLPPCYAMSGGTSAAAPAVAGLVATLVSGAKQKGLPVNAERVMWAIRASAQPIAGVAASTQGAGVPQADRAWALLASSVPTPPRIDSIGPVAHVLAPYLAMPGQGSSLYEREGWSRLASVERTLSLIPRGGPSTATRYNLRLRLDDGTFTAQPSVMLTKDRASQISITASPHATGLHSALLELINPSTSHVITQKQLNIIAADAIDPQAHRSLHYADTLGAFDSRAIPVTVPPGTPALQVNARLSGDALLWIFEPRGEPYPRGYAADVRTPVQGGWSTRRTTLPNPAAGTWIFMIGRGSDVSSRYDTSPVNFELDVAPARLDATMTETSTPGEYDLAWSGSGGFNVPPTPLLAQRSSTPHIVPAAPAVEIIPLDVPPDTALWTVRVRGNSATDLIHAYLYDCTKTPCTRNSSAVPAAREQVFGISRPGAGLWRVAVTAGPGTSTSASFVVESTVATTRLQSHLHVEPTRTDTRTDAGAGPDAGAHAGAKGGTRRVSVDCSVDTTGNLALMFDTKLTDSPAEHVAVVPPLSLANCVSMPGKSAPTGFASGARPINQHD
jgi:hypothetical protein